MGSVFQVVTNKGGLVVGTHKKRKDAIDQLYQVMKDEQSIEQKDR